MDPYRRGSVDSNGIAKGSRFSANNLTQFAFVKDVKSFGIGLCTLLGEEEAISFLEHSLSYLLSRNSATADAEHSVRATTIHDTGGDGESDSEKERQKQEIIKANARGSRDAAADGVVPLVFPLLVFEYLDYPTLCHCSLVCKTWAKACLHPALWHTFFQNKTAGPNTLDMQFDTHTQQDKKGLDKILRLRRFSGLVSLDMSHWRSKIDDSWVTSSLTHLTNLRFLSLKECNKLSLSTPWITRLTNLTSLDISTKSTGKLITNDSLRDISTLTKLSSLNIHYCEQITSVGLKYIAGLPRLRDLDIGDCYKLGRNTFTTLLPRIQTLTRLVLLSPARSNSFIKDDTMTILAQFLQLRSLDLGWCVNISSEGVKNLSVLTNLTFLGLGATAVTDTAIEYLKSCKNLTGLSLQMCDKVTTEGVAHTLNNFAKLRSLNLSGIPLGKSTEHLDRMGWLFSLEELDFTNSYIIDDVFIKPEYFSRSPALKRISLGFNSGITDRAILSMTTNCAMEYVDVSHCPKLTDKSLEYCAECKTLKVIDISNIYRITQTGVEQLRAKRPDMQIITQSVYKIY